MWVFLGLGARKTGLGRQEESSGVVVIPVVGARFMFHGWCRVDFDFLFSFHMAGKGNVALSRVARRCGRDVFLMAFAMTGRIGGSLHVML